MSEFISVSLSCLLLSPACMGPAWTKEQVMGAMTQQCRSSSLDHILRPSTCTVSEGRLSTDVVCDINDILSDPDNCKEIYWDHTVINYTVIDALWLQWLVEVMNHPQTKDRQVLHTQHMTYIDSFAMSGHIIKRK